MFDKLQQLYIQAPVRGLTAHRAIGDALTDLAQLEELSIGYMGDKINVLHKERWTEILDFDSASESL